MLIDIHTHRRLPVHDHFALRSLYDAFFSVIGEGSFSIGLHPWYLSDWEEKTGELQALADHPHVLAIGECGLDKVCDTPWTVQLAALNMQIVLANAVKKPLVIHCVRAYSEVSTALLATPVSVPVIFHGFNKRWEVAAPLLAKGWYLSFGSAILHSDGAAAAVLAQVPAAQFFLETDDADVSIADIYERAAALRNTTVNALTLQLEENFKNVFGK